MIFAIGTTNKMKIDAAAKVISKFVKKPSIVSYNAHSKVPETPLGKHTFNGACNRALETVSNVRADFYIGLESGLISRYGTIYEEVWCCIIDRKGNRYYAYSSGLKVPESIIKVMNAKKMTHNKVMEIFQKRYNLPKSDTWGNYTGNAIGRSISIEEAVRNAMIQIFPNDKSLYRL
ncbi:MAG: DUF84 family protein [Candidatus Micrarchaeia archaeon]